jgi:pyrimidine operon attenuation protein/uracil phosphoribosyltransferase
MANPDVAVPALIDTMADRLRELLRDRSIAAPAMIGIRTGGVWVAERMRDLLGLDEPLGTLDISFYRDDFSRIGINPQVRPSDLPLSVEDRDIVLVDDVLHTGRTIRAAMNELFDFGRPASIILVTLVDRGGRELPIQADVTGTVLRLAPNEHVKLTGPDPLELGIVEAHVRKSRV